MKKTLLLLTTFYFFTSAFAAFEIKSLNKANEIFLSVGKDIKITVMDLSVISIKDFEKLTGRHLNFFDRLGFSAGQKKLQKSIDPDGTINNQQLLKFTNPKEGHSVGSAIGWFFIGWFLSIIGVLLAYVIQAEDTVKKHRIKWAWIGFGVSTLLYLFFALAFAAAWH